MLRLLDHVPIEPVPEWALSGRFADVRRGILYLGLDVEVVRRILETAGPIAGWGAIGPRLFWSRSDGPFVAYDRDLVDQNADLRVIERPWPWCWGDEVVGVARWDEQPVAFRLLPGESELFVGSPSQPLAAALLTDLVGRRFRRWTGGLLADLGLPFWRFRAR